MFFEKQYFTTALVLIFFISSPEMPVFDQYDYTTASPNQDEQTTAADFGNGGAGYDDQGEWWWYE